jgi:beta-barrel assembly-enhancing protease
VRSLARLAIALIMMLFGLVSYCGNTVYNPITGENQRVGLSPRQEVALGLQSRQQMAARHGGLFPDDPLQRYIDYIGERVVKTSSAAQAPYPFEFHLLRDPDTINAFALPGGQVFLTFGLLRRLGNESQVAAVLGHEVGHVVGRHGAEHLAKQNLGASLVNAVGVAASDGYGGGQNAALIAQSINQLVSLKYGRKDELESDRLGFKFMTEAGYDPRGILEVMNVLAQASKGPRQPELLSSHPDPGNRFEELKGQIQAAFPQGIPRNLETGDEQFNQQVRSRLGGRP